MGHKPTAGHELQECKPTGKSGTECNVYMDPEPTTLMVSSLPLQLHQQGICYFKNCMIEEDGCNREWRSEQRGTDRRAQFVSAP